MSKHTPGPWRLRRTGKEAPDDMIVMDGPGSGICDCSPGNPDITVEEAMANARLIAAAPEMLDTLQELVEFLDDQADAEYFTDRAAPVPNDAMRLLVKVRAAIAKAEGRQP